ncbi:hypothetical protein BCR42DRAFT_403077 [Absidia repens]|uniref:Uncharacterized protein n=1 Tax=Absidia repens TaxID=90262 RepID=A0A1X2J0I8_9FUNG|nr:hypothetical protein BCR42DRAFT_403077 [Absidia repens]
MCCSSKPFFLCICILVRHSPKKVDRRERENDVFEATVHRYPRIISVEQYVQPRYPCRSPLLFMSLGCCCSSCSCCIRIRSSSLGIAFMFSSILAYLPEKEKNKCSIIITLPVHTFLFVVFLPFNFKYITREDMAISVT